MIVTFAEAHRGKLMCRGDFELRYKGNERVRQVGPCNEQAL